MSETRMSKLDRFMFLMWVGFVRLFTGRENAIKFADWLEPLITENE